MRFLICKECGKRHDRRANPCGQSRDELIAARDQALARVAELENAFISDLGSYRRCLYCCERWESSAPASHHGLCILSVERL